MIRSTRLGAGYTSVSQLPTYGIPVGEATMLADGTTEYWNGSSWSPVQTAPIANPASFEGSPFQTPAGPQCAPGFSVAANGICMPAAASAAVSTAAAAVPILMPNVSPTITIPTPVATVPAPAAATPTNFTYTADIETVQNQLDLSGDTWDNAQAIVGQLYAAGIAPGTVTTSMALNYMTGVTDTAAATATTSLTSLPWYYYAAGAAALFVFFGSSSRK